MLRTNVPARRLRAAGGEEEDGDESRKRSRSSGACAHAGNDSKISGLFTLDTDVCDRCPVGRVPRSQGSPTRCDHGDCVSACDKLFHSGADERCANCASHGGAAGTDDDI